MAKLLNSLPDSYDSLKRAWDSTHPDYKTKDELINRLMKEQVKAQPSKPTEDAAFVAKSNQQGRQQKRKGKCNNCGKLGHWAQDCWSKKRDFVEKPNPHVDEAINRFSDLNIRNQGNKNDWNQEIIESLENRTKDKRMAPLAEDEMKNEQTYTEKLKEELGVTGKKYILDTTRASLIDMIEGNEHMKKNRVVDLMSHHDAKESHAQIFMLGYQMAEYHYMKRMIKDMNNKVDQITFNMHEMKDLVSETKSVLESKSKELALSAEDKRNLIADIHKALQMATSENMVKQLSSVPTFAEKYLILPHPLRMKLEQAFGKDSGKMKAIRDHINAGLTVTEALSTV